MSNVIDDINAGETGEVIETGEVQNKPEVDPGAYDYSKMVGENGALAEDWRNSLPEDIRSERCLESIKTVGTLVKSFVNAQKLVGANKIAVPGENATKAEINDFYTALGRPESADKYSYDQINLPDGVVIDEELAKEYKDKAFALGLNQKTFAALMEYDVQRVAAQIAAADAAATAEYNETMTKLKADHGAQTTAYLAQYKKTLDTFGLTQLFIDKGVINNYDLICAMVSIGAKISESKLVDGDLPAKFSDPQSRINEIRNDPEHPFYKKDHPGHAAAVNEVRDLTLALSKANKK